MRRLGRCGGALGAASGAVATNSPRSPGATPFRVGTMKRRGAGSIDTMLGTATTTQPAAPADSTPGGESSIATHCAGSTPRASAASRYGCGCGLPCSTASPVMTAWNVIGASASTIGIDEPGPRHRHQRARHAEGVQLGEQPPRPGTPRHVLAHAGDHAVEQPLDDLLRLEVDAAAVTQLGGRVEQVEADDRAGVVVGPGATEGSDELVLARHPVRLGVDERAVHVPQDGGGWCRDRGAVVIGRASLTPGRAR